MILRPYQSAIIEDIRSCFSDGDTSVLVQLPTGGGKTVIFSYICSQAAAKGTRTCVLVHRDTLLRQASEKLDACGVAHGIIAPGHRRTSNRIQVASIQTLARRLDQHEFDLLIPDEAHHATSSTWANVLAANPSARVLGFTATPCRTDGRGLNEQFERLVLGPTIRDLTADGFLVPPVVYASARRLDLAQVHRRAGDYDRHELAVAMDTPMITGDAVDHYLRLARGVPAVAFCVSVQHAQDVAADFRAAGIRAASIHGKMPVDTIRDTVAGLSDGRVEVLASCDLISEGFDAPAVGAAILLRPTQSLGLYIQQVGRSLRPAPGKAQAIILDHADNCFKHGMPDDDREWTLEGRPKRKGHVSTAVAVRQCPKCFACHKPAPMCSQCGHVYEIEAREVERVAGDLKQVDRALIAKQKRREVGRARTLEELQEIGRRRGYRPAWASIIWQARGNHTMKSTSGPAA